MEVVDPPWGFATRQPCVIRRASGPEWLEKPVECSVPVRQAVFTHTETALEYAFWRELESLYRNETIFSLRAGRSNLHQVCLVSLMEVL